MQVSHYLKMYLRHPLLIERLTKAGFETLLQMLYTAMGSVIALDEMQTKTHRILRVENRTYLCCRSKKQVCRC